jgi:pimeloyl-ACP methyl ester carboxylesterase
MLGVGLDPDWTAATEPQPPPESPAAAAVEGLFDVGGHRLYIRCVGTGSPTVVFMHGMIVEPGPQPHLVAQPIQDLLADDYRTCIYERRNVALSDTVDAPQGPADVTGDLHALLAAAGIEPPIVLIGASVGGLLAYLYTNTYPDDVVGMVLLDSMFPDELSLEGLFPPDQRYEALGELDEVTLERLNRYELLVAANEFVGAEPAIPVIYLAAAQEPWNVLGVPEYDAVILDLQEGFVERFSPGELRWVDAPHMMVIVAADEIADATRDVIALAAG